MDVARRQVKYVAWMKHNAVEEERDQDPRMKLPRGMDLAFLRDTSGNPAIAEIQALIRKHRQQ